MNVDHPGRLPAPAASAAAASRKRMGQASDSDSEDTHAYYHSSEDFSDDGFQPVLSRKAKRRNMRTSSSSTILTCELIRFFGFSCETFEATTDDGYIIEVDRVGLLTHDNGTSSTENSTKRYPIIMAPGVLTDSGSWFTNFPSQSPGFLVAQRGYDVWTMNTREITDRSHHKTLSQNVDRYWQWSFDEIGRYDIAAVIDLVLNVTGASKVNMLTFSQGWSGTLVLLSTRPEYNDKVGLILAYGPVANLSLVGYPLRELIPFADPFFLLLDPLRGSDYFFVPDTPKSLILFVCTILRGQPCNFIVFLTAFVSPEQLNKTRSPLGLAHYVHGTSYQNLRHFVQVNRAKDFLMYDHGTSENRKRYGQDDPPAYDVDRVTTKVALFSSQGDMVADPEDVSLLVERLGSNLLFHYVVEPKDFRHLDFCWGYRANDIVHNLMLDTLEKYSGTST